MKRNNKQRVTLKRYALVDLRESKPLMIIESDQHLNQEEADELLKRFYAGLISPNEYRAIVLDKGMHIHAVGTTDPLPEWLSPDPDIVSSAKRRLKEHADNGLTFSFIGKKAYGKTYGESYFRDLVRQSEGGEAAARSADLYSEEV